MGNVTTFVLQIGVPDYLEEAITGVINFLPQLIGALIILAIGWIIGRLVGGITRRLSDRTNVDRLVMNTPLGRVLGGTEKSISNSLGRVAAYFIYALAILTAADALAIDLLSEWIAVAVTYLPALVAGGLIIIFGFILADILADLVAGTESLTSFEYTEPFADGLRFLLYFVAIVVGLDTIGVDVQILYLFAGAVAGGLALGTAIAIGLAFGLGGRDWVAANIGEWLPGRSPSSQTAPMGQTDGGEEPVD